MVPIGPTSSAYVLPLRPSRGRVTRLPYGCTAKLFSAAALPTGTRIAARSPAMLCHSLMLPARRKHD